MSLWHSELGRGTRAGRHRVLIASVMAVTATAAMALTAIAQEASPAPKLETTITLGFEPSSMEGIPHYLTARLLAEDGSAVIGERVSIGRDVDVFGGRSVTVGRASTDNAGIARIPVEPREKVYTLTASFGGSERFGPSQAEDDVVFPIETVAIPESAPWGGLVDPQLRPLAEVMPAVIGLGVIAVWIVLLGLTISTLVSIRSDRRSGDRAPGQVEAEMPGSGPGPQNV